MHALVRAALLLLALAPAARAEWPHVRGPAYDGHSPETGLADRWPEGGPPVLWTRELGRGHSGFVSDGRRVFTQDQTRGGSFVVALDADTGADVWRTRVDVAWQHGGQYPGPYATPTLHAGRIYFTTPTGIAGGLDAATGREVWSRNVRADFAGRGFGFGYGATPTVEGGRVFLPVGGDGASVVSLDAADGSTVWAAGDDAASYAPILPVTLNGRRVLVAFLENALAVHDAGTGRRLWRLKLSAHYDEHSVWPVYAEPHLLVASPFRAGGRLFRLDDGPERVTGTQVWAVAGFSNDVCSAVRAGGHVYGFDLHQQQASVHRPGRGAFKCLDFLTGKTCWETDEVGHATALVADGKLILLNETGTLILTRPDPAGYAELARAKVLDGRTMGWTPPALDRGRLFVRNQERIACVFLGPPEALDPARPLAPPPAAGPRFDWLWLMPKEPDFPNDEPHPDELLRWFAWCLGVFAAAGTIAYVVRTLRERSLWNRSRSERTTYVFATTAFALGAGGTTALGAWADTFALTWPAALYVLLRATLAAGVAAEGGSWRKRAAARLALLGFAAACFGYYRLCMAVGYVVAWGFLVGFVPALPFAVVAARADLSRVRWAADALGFTVMFWAGGLVPGWKAAWA